MGVEYVGPSPNVGNAGDYMEILAGANDAIEPIVHFTYVPGSVVKAQTGTKVLGRI
jgi:hypothetical protein